MASEGVHLDLANRNQEFLNSIASAPTPFADWIATVAFYKAVHIAEAVFATNEPHLSQHSTNHAVRNDLLRKSYPDMWRRYSPLYRASRIARYLEYQNQKSACFSFYMTHDVVMNELLDVDLVGLEAEAVPLLSGKHRLVTYRTVPTVSTAPIKAASLFLPPAAKPKA